MVHVFTRANKFIALDTGSGCVHILDEVAYNLLKILPKQYFTSQTSFANIVLPKNLEIAENTEEAYNQLLEIAKTGLLYSDDSYDEFKDRLGLAPIKALCLNVSHDCNLRCKYCFAATGDFGGGRKLMDIDTAKKAIDLLVNLSDGRRNLEVDFFGGEPLMAFDVVRQCVDYARSIEKKAGKNFRFTITTNGLLLNDENIEYINKEMSNVVLSIDGRQEVNDRLRVRVDGSGSFGAIIPKYKKLVSSRGDKEYYVRGTYTRFNLDFDQDVLKLFELGFDQISVEPVVGHETDDYSIRNGDIVEIEKSYEKLMFDMIERKKNKTDSFNFFHFMLDLDNGPCAIKRLRGCGSGNEYIAITPDGEIYPCHQFVGNKDFLMGTVDDGLYDNGLKQMFADTNIFKKPTCEECWAKFFCSGGCNANNYNFSGSVLEPHALSCELEKMRLECAIAIQASLHDE